MHQFCSYIFSTHCAHHSGGLEWFCVVTRLFEDLAVPKLDDVRDVIDATVSIIRGGLHHPYISAADHTSERSSGWIGISPLEITHLVASADAFTRLGHFHHVILVTKIVFGLGIEPEDASPNKPSIISRYPSPPATSLLANPKRSLERNSLADSRRESGRRALPSFARRGWLGR
jgi:hypothetical protein